MKHLSQKTITSDIIRYANCWEDADILLEGLQPKAGSKILSIGSGGDNSLALLTSDPEKVVVVDFNKTQLLVIRLKIAAIKTLSRIDCIAFLGYTESGARASLYKEVRQELSVEERRFWDDRLDEIKDGIIHAGKFEKYFLQFCAIVKDIHDESIIEELFAEKTEEEQALFYKHIWKTPQWESSFKHFFGREMMAKIGREPEFLKEVIIDVGEYIFKKTEGILSSRRTINNPMLRFILTGSFQGSLPLFLRKNAYTSVQKRLDRLCLHQGDVQSALSIYGTMNYMNLSNIFEYMDIDTFTDEIDKIEKNLHTGGKIAYWNLMVPRHAHRVSPLLQYKKKISEVLTQRDSGFFYQSFNINQKL